MTDPILEDFDGSIEPVEDETSTVIVRNGVKESQNLGIGEHTGITLDSIDIPAGLSVTIYANADKMGFRSQPFYDGMYTELQTLYNIPTAPVLVVVTKTDTEYGDLVRVINRLVVLTRKDGTEETYTSIAAIPGAVMPGEKTRIAHKIYTLEIGNHVAQSYSVGEQGNVTSTFPDNAIDFIDIPEGLEVRVFLADNFEGKHYDFQGNIPNNWARVNLRKLKLNNRISSISIQTVGTFAKQDSIKEAARIEGTVLEFKGRDPIVPADDIAIPETCVKYGGNDWQVLGVGDHINVNLESIRIADGHRVRLFNDVNKKEKISFDFYKGEYPRLDIYDIPETVPMLAVRETPYKYHDFMVLGWTVEVEEDNQTVEYIAKQQMPFKAYQKHGYIRGGKDFINKELDYIWLPNEMVAYLFANWDDPTNFKEYMFKGKTPLGLTRYILKDYKMNDMVSEIVVALNGKPDLNVSVAKCQLRALDTDEFIPHPTEPEWNFDYDVRHTAQLKSGQDEILALYFRHGVPVAGNLGWFYKRRTTLKYDPIFNPAYSPAIKITKRDGSEIEIDDYNHFEYHQVEPYKHHYYVNDWMAWFKNGVIVEQINIKDIQSLYLL